VEYGFWRSLRTTESELEQNPGSSFHRKNYEIVPPLRTGNQFNVGQAARVISAQNSVLINPLLFDRSHYFL
jgi:hypothetical protein